MLKGQRENKCKGTYV